MKGDTIDVRYNIRRDKDVNTREDVCYIDDINVNGGLAHTTPEGR